MDLCRCFAGSDEPNPNCPVHGSYPLNRDPQTGRYVSPPKTEEQAIKNACRRCGRFTVAKSGFCFLCRDERPKNKPGVTWDSIPIIEITEDSAYRLECSPWFIPVIQYGKASHILPGECGAIECPPAGAKMVWEYDGNAWSRIYYPAFRLIAMSRNQCPPDLRYLTEELDASAKALFGWLSENPNPVGINLYAHAGRLANLALYLRKDEGA